MDAILQVTQVADPEDAPRASFSILIGKRLTAWNLQILNRETRDFWARVARIKFELWSIVVFLKTRQTISPWTSDAPWIRMCADHTDSTNSALSLIITPRYLVMTQTIEILTDITTSSLTSRKTTVSWLTPVLRRYLIYLKHFFFVVRFVSHSERRSALNGVSKQPRRWTWDIHQWHLVWKISTLPVIAVATLHFRCFPPTKQRVNCTIFFPPWSQDILVQNKCRTVCLWNCRIEFTRTTL